MNAVDLASTFAIPFVLIMGGGLMWKKTPKKNYLFGWRTSIAMKSEDNFKFANKYGGRAMFVLGIGELTATFVFILIDIYSKFNGIEVLYVIMAQTVLLFALIFKVEKDLRKKLL